MVVAVPIEPAMTAATTKETRFGIAFGIEFGKLKAAAVAVGDEGYVMIFAHWMINGNIVFVFDELTLSLVCIVRCFRFQRRQRNTTAGDHCWPHGLEHITADWADIKLGFEHVGGAIGVDDLFASKQLCHRHLQCLCQWLQQSDIRKSTAGIT